jgi:hypothetical protein
MSHISVGMVGALPSGALRDFPRIAHMCLAVLEDFVRLERRTPLPALPL